MSLDSACRSGHDVGFSISPCQFSAQGCLSPWTSPGMTQAQAWSSEPPRDSRLPSHYSDTLTVCLNHLESENRFSYLQLRTLRAT